MKQFHIHAPKLNGSDRPFGFVSGLGNTATHVFEQSIHGIIPQTIVSSTSGRVGRSTPKSRRAYPASADGRGCRTPKTMSATR